MPTRNASERVPAVCRNQHWFSKADDTVCRNANFNASSMSRAPSDAVARHGWTAGPFRVRRAARYHATVTTTLSPRDKAAQDAAALVSYLRTLPPGRCVGELIDLGEHLDRAIRAFHMEAIRFRAFTMSRLIKQHQANCLPTCRPHGHDSPRPRGRRLPDAVGHRIERDERRMPDAAPPVRAWAAVGTGGDSRRNARSPASRRSCRSACATAAIMSAATSQPAELVSS